MTRIEAILQKETPVRKTKDITRQDYLYLMTRHLINDMEEAKYDALPKPVREWVDASEVIIRSGARKAGAPLPEFEDYEHLWGNGADDSADDDDLETAEAESEQETADADEDEVEEEAETEQQEIDVEVQTATATKAKPAKTKAAKPAKKAATKAKVAKPKKAAAKAKTAKAAKPKAAKAKRTNGAGARAALKVMLTRKEGVTRAEALKKIGWVAISFQQNAKALGLKLKVHKTKGEPTRYYGS